VNVDELQDGGDLGRALKDGHLSFETGLEAIVAITPARDKWNEAGQEKASSRRTGNLSNSLDKIFRRRFQKPVV
jgi:hypothetical protein